MSYDLAKAIQESAGNPKLVGWQFAADGQWDIAHRQFFQDSSGLDTQEFIEWLKRQPTNNIALEAVFSTQADEKFFLGVRVTHLSHDNKTAIICAAMESISKHESLHKTLTTLRELLGDKNLIKNSPEYLELGVFDLWNRVKSVVVWQKDQRVSDHLLSPDEIRANAEKPDDGFPPLHEMQVKPLMLEAAWRKGANRPFQSWISLPVSECISGKYGLCMPKYRRAAMIFLGP